jgi:phenylacetic acid degradation operon negative regulatory protein
VVASTLLGVDPPRLPTSSLVRTGSLFGVNEGTMRVAMSRMVAKGELEPDSDGYRLAGPFVARQERQEQSRRGDTGDWDGSWEMAVVANGARSAADRVALRRALEDLRLAEWREGVWVRPENLPAGRAGTSRLRRDEQCAVIGGARPDPSCGLRFDATELWDLAAWSDGARSLLAEMAEIEPQMSGDHPTALAPAFECAAAVLRHSGADPLLPDLLLPADWPGRELRHVYERFVARFQTTLRLWMRRGS